jgi:hypothetical protein
VSTPISSGSSDWLRTMADCNCRCVYYDDAVGLEAAADKIDQLERENTALHKHLAEMRSMFHDMADRFGRPEYKTYLFDDFMRMKRELLARELLRETAYPARAKEGGAS